MWLIVVALLGFTALVFSAFGIGRNRSRSIVGRHVVVTGGSQGIGLWAAVRCAQLGANVTIVARNQQLLEKAQLLIEEHRASETQSVHIASVDVCSSYETIASRFRQIETVGGPIYMLINCAGMAICATVADTSVEVARRMMDLNYFGTFQPTRWTLQGMQERGEGGVIVLCSSMAGLLGVYGMGAYCASKFALRGLAEALQLENAHRGISVTLAFPGDTDTPGLAAENVTKPEITKLMSSEGGLVAASVMGGRIVDDALRGSFFSVVDLTSWAVATMCAGLSPWGNWSQAVLSAMLLGPLKLYSAHLWRSFRTLVATELAK